jgi:phage FluMu protein Com
METSNETKYHISTWKAFSNAKCPRCRVGNVFIGSTYSFKAQKMNEHCPHCNLKFEREPGYFYVAMFVSYAFNVAEIVTASVAAYIFGLELDYENLYYFIAVLFVTSIVFAPFNFRYSRMVLLYWLSPGLHYEPWRSAPKNIN